MSNDTLTFISDETEFKKLFPTRSKWQTEVAKFLDASEMFASISAKDDGDLNRIAVGLRTAIDKLAPGRIKIKTSTHTKTVGLTKITS